MQLILAFVVALLLSALLGKLIIPVLRRMKAGQSIKEIGPRWHMTKQGTPTMGGIIFALAVLITIIVLGFEDIRNGEYAHIFIFGIAAVFGAIGYVDDYVKVKKKQNTGLTALQKLLLQLAAAIAFLALLRYFGYLSSKFYVPFFNVTLEVPWIVYMIISSFIIVGAINAVNITDGVDGLAAGVTTPVSIFFAVVAMYWGYETVGLFAAALAGALIGFLFYNYNPAKVFMGDTGSLFLGGAICGMAFALDIPLILAIVGFVYIAETLSDIIQVIYYKLTQGKRIFKMAPLHHHFEMSGWSEKKIFWVFVGVTVLFCGLGLWAVSMKYVL